MKITREFIFAPSWDSRGWSWETSDDCFLIPADFNVLARIINQRGWEIERFWYVEDEDEQRYKRSYLKTAHFICSKEVSDDFEEESYFYVMRGINKMELCKTFNLELELL